MTNASTPRSALSDQLVPGERATAPDATLLDPALLARLERVQLATRKRLAGQLAGDHRSPRLGASLDFADYREYHPGDDFRRIDYHLYARLDQLLVKLYDAEDDLTLRLLVDTSASMAAYGKLDCARRIAAALGFVALLRRDPVTLHTFPVLVQAPRFMGRNAAWQLFDHLSRLTAGGTTSFAAAASDLLARPGPRGITVVLSDLLTPDWEDGLRRLRGGRSDVVVVHVLGREDLHPSLIGDLDLIDAEHGGEVGVSATPDTIREYERIADAWANAVGTCARQGGASYVRVLADRAIEDVLFGGWQSAGVLR